MAEPVEEYFVGFVYSVVYRSLQGKVLIVEGELLFFDDKLIEVKLSKGSVIIEKTQIDKISRK